MSTRPTLDEALAAALLTPPPAWDRVLGLGYGGVTHVFTLSVRLAPEVDLAPLEAAVAARWPPRQGAYHRHGRTIRFTGREVVLVASGTADAPPGDDGVQSALLLALVEAARPAIVGAVTDRWTDSPFEEPAPRQFGATEARALLDDLVRQTLGLSVDTFDFFTTPSNPEVRLRLTGAAELSFGVRARWLPVCHWIRPGELTLEATAQASAFPGYHPDLCHQARAVLWCSEPLHLAGAAGEVIRLGLTRIDPDPSEAEEAFLAQRGEGASMGPPPPPRLNLRLTAHSCKTTPASLSGSRRR